MSNTRISPYDRGQMAARNPGSLKGLPYGPGKAQLEFLRGFSEGRLELAHSTLKAAQRRRSAVTP